MAKSAEQKAAEAQVAESAAQNLSDVKTQTPEETQAAVVQQGDLVQVAATYSTMNTANSAGTGNKPTEAEMKRDVEAAARILETSEKKSISIPKQMVPILGETMISCINGACIRVPIDGNSYDIPAPYHQIITDSLKTIHAGDVRDEYGFGDKVLDAALTPGK